MPVFTIISLPANFTTDITANASDLVGDLTPYITLVIGVLLAVVVIAVLINAIRH